MKNLFIMLGILAMSTACTHTPTPPVAKKIPRELTENGNVRTDNYFWLNERENPEVIDYLKAENAYLKSVMKHTETLQAELYKEIRSRIKEQDESVPHLYNGYYYYSRTLQDTEYFLLCRKKGSLEATEEVYLDVNELAKGHAFYSVGGAAASPDNKILVYAIDTVSRRFYDIYFKNLETGELYADVIPNTTGNVVWANDNKTVFYTKQNPETLRSERVMKHILGTPTAEDKVIYFEKDETFSVRVSKTKSEKYITIHSNATLTSEIQLLDASHPDNSFTMVEPREKEVSYGIEDLGNDFYILTNWKAKNYRLMKTPVNKLSKANWKEVIPGRDSVQLEDMDVFSRFIVVNEVEEGIDKMRIIRLSDMQSIYIPMDEPIYTAGLSVNRVLDTDWVRYSYTSMITPSTTYEYNMVTGERKLLKQQEAPTYNKDLYETYRVYAAAGDGKKIPVSIVQKKGVQLNGENPTLLYGYGSYGNTIYPTFSSSRISLLDRGFVYAIAHVRGGSIYGRDWYEEGRLLNKKNTFTDFISCAEYLIKEKYTNPAKLFANGGSAGGLLVGAVANMRPDLFKGIIADVPFVDVLTTMLDESIPLTTGEYSEWGNPHEKTYYDYMLSYSPYDNVAAKNYPAMLVFTGLHDSQVQYFEPAKWVAKLRATKTDSNPLLFSINMDYGHGGASGRFEFIKEIALEYAFMLDLLGIKK